MDLERYILRPNDLVWSAWLAPWEPLLPDEVTPWFLNRFGEPLLVFADGSVHLLVPELELVRRLAENRDALARQWDDAAQAEPVLRMSEVDALLRSGLVLRPGQCYGFQIPLLMAEGRRTLANARVWDIPTYYAFLVDVHRQTRDLPDGAHVRLRPRAQD